ncbi:hypothetical protein [Psychrobacillus sp. AK 1817]|nr:hypothetical protein [Psychrobacillus sp. AK 1817]
MGKSDISTQVGQLMIVGFKGKTVPEKVLFNLYMRIQFKYLGNDVEY